MAPDSPDVAELVEMNRRHCPPPPPSWEEQLRVKEEAGWVRKRVAMSMLLDDETAVMTKAEFDSLAEYSTSLPTGTYSGKIWKCRRPYRGDPAAWYMGEYFDDGTPGMMAIRWRTICVVG